ADPVGCLSGSRQAGSHVCGSRSRPGRHRAYGLRRPWSRGNGSRGNRHTLSRMSEAAESRPRLDQLLVERGLFATRSRARDAIARGTVKVDGKPVTKPGQTVARNAAIAVDDPASTYVSRAALKLIAALDHFNLDVTGRTALDIGASTGG